MRHYTQYPSLREHCRVHLHKPRSYSLLLLLFVLYFDVIGSQAGLFTPASPETSENCSVSPDSGFAFVMQVPDCNFDCQGIHFKAG